MGTTTKEKHCGEHSVQVWLHEDRLTELDRNIGTLTAGIPGAHVTRHGWIRAIVYRALDAARAQTTSQTAVLK